MGEQDLKSVIKSNEGIYSRLSRNNTVRESCNGLVTVGPTKFHLDFLRVTNPAWIAQLVAHVGFLCDFFYLLLLQNTRSSRTHGSLERILWIPIGGCLTRASVVMC